MLPIQKYIEHSRYELSSQNINMLQDSMFWAKVQNLVKNMVDGTLCDLENWSELQKLSTSFSNKPLKKCYTEVCYKIQYPGPPTKLLYLRT